MPDCVDYVGLCLTMSDYVGYIPVEGEQGCTDLAEGDDVGDVLHQELLDYAGLCPTVLTMPDYVKLCWTLPDYVGLCWTLPDYVGLCLTMSDYA